MPCGVYYGGRDVVGEHLRWGVFVVGGCGGRVRGSWCCYWGRGGVECGIWRAVSGSGVDIVVDSEWVSGYGWWWFVGGCWAGGGW